MHLQKSLPFAVSHNSLSGIIGVAHTAGDRATPGQVHQGWEGPHEILPTAAFISGEILKLVFLFLF